MVKLKVASTNRPVEPPTDFVIEKNFPIPSLRGAVKYPFAKMEVGDSFFVSGEGGVRDRVHSASSQYGKRHSKRFTTRRFEGGVRVWRIK